jgi:hypothetical protein
MARHLESLKHIGWSTCFFWGSSIGKGDESVIEEVAENKLDNIASVIMNTGNFDECVDECNVGLTTELFITKTSTRTTVERVV